jgi:hypothetical protein
VTVGYRVRLALVAAVVVTGGGCGWFDGATPLGAPGTTTSTRPPRPQGPPDAVATQFLAAWAAGNDATAAELTDAPAAATKVLAGFRTQLPVAAIKTEATPTPAQPEVVPFTANVELKDIGTWTYQSTIRVIDAKGQWRVAWAPSVLHPRLPADGVLVLTEQPGQSTAKSVQDRHGNPLNPAEHPSLAPTILPAILKSADPAKGASGFIVQLKAPAGGIATLEQVRPAGASGAAPSTLDAGIQRAAQSALGAAGMRPTALVVIEASTGQILAMATSNPQNRMTTLKQAPGSAFKIIVASALLNAGLTPDSPASCPGEHTIPYGRKFVNEHAEHNNLDADFAYDFAWSCNTAFVREGQKHLTAQGLIDHAAAVYGLGEPWDIGLGDAVKYWGLPNPGGNKDLWGESLIGQGNVTMAPLALASVVATAMTGRFRQPIIHPNAQPRAARANAPSGGLKQMMRQTVSRGTASSLAGLGEVGAKTGTADIGGGNLNWMAAYRGDLAIACLVQGANQSSGNDAAGPVVAQFLRSV